MKKIAVFGSTGSIGTQALEIAEVFPEEIKIVCLSAQKNIEKLARQANKFKPAYIAISNKEDIGKLSALLNYRPFEIIAGDISVEQLIDTENFDLAVLAVSGIAGLPIFAKCLERNLPTALANKESIVCGGNVIRELMNDKKTRVLPVDSEHCAIFQCLGNTYDTADVSKIWLTASGGPFLNYPKEKIEHAPLEAALRHPNWDMGKRITIQSASMSNKGLEVIEAHYLYGIAPENIKVVIQPQSLVHSMVEMTDLSVLAQFAPVDMRLPLQKAMLYPKIYKFTVNKPIDFTKIGKIEFIEPDFDKFPALKLAYEAIDRDLTAVYSISNEAAVDAYLDGEINFGSMSRIILAALKKFSGYTPVTVDEILNLDIEVRKFVHTYIKTLS